MQPLLVTTEAVADMIFSIAGRLSIRSVFYISAAILTLFGAFALLAAIAAMSNATLLLGEASRSYEQLAIVTRLEADLQSLLLDVERVQDAAGRSNANTPTAHPAGTQNFERRLAIYMDSIRHELSLRKEQQRAGSHTSELAEAEALQTIFRELLSDLESKLAVLGTAEPRLLRSGDELSRQRVADLRRRVHDIVEGERREVDESIEAMAELRSRFIRRASVVAVAGSAILALILLYLHRAIIAPLNALTAGNRQFGQGSFAARVTPDGARDVVELGLQFNRMADRIACQHKQLVAINETLELAVAERTRDLEAKSEQLAEIDRTRRLFFAKIGHELRTPVTVLCGEAEVALRNKAADTPTLREALNHIVANGDVLQRRLEDLLTLARAEDGRLGMRRQIFDVVACVKRATDQAVAFAASSGVRLAFVGCAADSVMIEGDESWIRQAVLSIIDNAIKFSPAEGEVTVSLAGDAPLFAIEIADEGPGVPQEIMDRLFEPYFQGAASTEGRAGSGLGLAVARWVVEQHGGTIAASNRAERGFTISMALPSDGGGTN